MKFKDIPQFTRFANYSVHIGWDYIEESLSRYKTEYGLDMDPDFQRAHVWSEFKQRRYIEFVLKGGKSSQDIHLNCIGWGSSSMPHSMVLVDGKQRIEAVRKFLRNELAILGKKTSEGYSGYYYKDFTDKLRFTTANFYFHINDLDTRKEVLQWYIDLNAGGVAHTKEEIDKVKELLRKEQK